ncbi:MAG: type II toxin-antitoxin system Phd/YefM family antitoxin, partial [Acidimicrobiia bacterium]
PYEPMVRTVGLKVLKNRLSEYVRLASGGETFLITDRDKVVAELVPPEPSRSRLVPDAILADMVREGLITSAMRRGGQLPEVAPVGTLDQILKELDELRADR